MSKTAIKQKNKNKQWFPNFQFQKQIVCKQNRGTYPDLLIGLSSPHEKSKAVPIKLTLLFKNKYQDWKESLITGHHYWEIVP